MMEVIWEKDNLPHRETMAIWDEHHSCSPVNPGRVPTEEELTACPKIFTCFSCLEKHPQKETNTEQAADAHPCIKFGQRVFVSL
jgi:hypothetical protein